MSIDSSLGETKQSLTREPRLIDVVAALEKRGEQDEADYYTLVFAPFLSIIYGVSVDEIMMMPLDDLAQLSELPIKPLKYRDWDSFYFGRAAFGNNG